MKLCAKYSCCVLSDSKIMMLESAWSSLLLFGMFLLVESDPTCKYIGRRKSELVCSPGESDFVLKRGLVSDSNKTTGVTLSGCRISDVDYEAFENLFYLRCIDLSHNNISSLKLGVLDSTLQVRRLNLSYNSISNFPLGLFDQLPNLEALDLKANRITELELGIFDHLKKLKYLDLSGNDLQGKNMNPYIFDQSPEITHIDFSRNDMTDAPDNLLHALNNLEVLNLETSLLDEVPKFATKPNLKFLKELILSKNIISDLDNPATFVNVDRIQMLDLSDNVIESIHEDVFKPLKIIKILIIRNNIIKHIPDTLFLNMKSIGNIDLSHNLIPSVPVNAFRGTSLKNLNLSNNRFTYLTDNFCLELRNSGVNLKKFYFDRNPWQCACLLSLLDELKKFDITYNSVNYDGTHPICVTTADVQCRRQDSFNSIYTDQYDQLVDIASA